ncbi:MAG: Uncharacterized membrane protein YhaH, DUF805 family [Candidatus Kentron sp. G]|nr:MAG: Uncharacterized membrane protein YhaH, DUF805 family [Candidatus Kentron sp. G]VFN07998.1 MAG: Uncharacterized membrane protein YhaH, DUF805 family [Candidatus Kentron sp. G]
MNWYLDALKKYAVFSGRARRKEFWFFFLFNTIIFSILLFIDISMMDEAGFEYGISEPQTFMRLSGIYALAVFLPILAVWVRRLHDIGRSGWWVLLVLIPLGKFVLYIMAMFDSQPGENEYGPNPKGEMAW